MVEDDATLRALLDMALRGAGYRHVRTYARGDEAMAGLLADCPDLVVLDLMLPGLDGGSICRRLRADPRTAAVRILMLTARGEPEDIVRGLDSGADDYAVKPCERKILLARVRALLRRVSPASPAETLDGLRFDAEARSVELAGLELKLAPGEFGILELLLRNRGRVLTRERILESVARDDAREVTERTVDVQIATLRRKLGAWARHLETIRGVGYRLTV